MICIRLILIGFFLTSAITAHASNKDRMLVREAITDIRDDRPDFSMMKLKRFLRDYPDSKYSAEASFGLAESQFLLKQYNLAHQQFNQFINDYPDTEYELLAWVYLMYLAQQQADEDSILATQQAIREKANQISLIFRDHKEQILFSPLKRKFKIISYIDHIDFFIEGELFVQVTR